jgi:hypothetical protein
MKKMKKKRMKRKKRKKLKWRPDEGDQGHRLLLQKLRLPPPEDEVMEEDVGELEESYLGA